MRRAILAALALQTSACALFVHAPTTPSPEAGETYHAFRVRRNRVGDYLSPVEALLDTSLTPGISGRATLLAWQWSNLGAYPAVDDSFGASDERYLLESSEQSLVEAIDPRPAVDALCAAAHGRPLVMIDEEHPWPVDRAFGADVLPCLRAEGFDSLAVEMLTDDPSPIRDDGVPRSYGGNFTDEPRMSNLLSEAVSLGFRLVPYEKYSSAPDPNDRFDQREQGQADNLTAFLRDHAGARTVVWCGFDHVHEHATDADPRWRWLAERLRAATGIDPFTIAQIAGHVRDEEAGPLFVAVNRHRNTPGPLFVELASRWERIPASFRQELASLEPGSPPVVDAVVIHESRRAGDARHLWLEAPPENAHPIRVPCDRRRHPLGLLVQLFRDRDGSARDVPYDQTLCPCDGSSELVAPPGRWFVVVRDESAPLLAAYTTLGPEPLVLRP